MNIAQTCINVFFFFLLVAGGIFSGKTLIFQLILMGKNVLWCVVLLYIAMFRNINRVLNKDFVLVSCVQSPLLALVTADVIQ
jgi:hypothetical protein